VILGLVMESLQCGSWGRFPSLQHKHASTSSALRPLCFSRRWLPPPTFT
jgi:hypothetical protein